MSKIITYDIFILNINISYFILLINHKINYNTVYFDINEQ